MIPAQLGMSGSPVLTASSAFPVEELSPTPLGREYSSLTLYQQSVNGHSASTADYHFVHNPAFCSEPKTMECEVHASSSSHTITQLSALHLRTTQ